jgi:uncharacterized integral membrane protein
MAESPNPPAIIVLKRNNYCTLQLTSGLNHTYKHIMLKSLLLTTPVFCTIGMSVRYRTSYMQHMTARLYAK